MNLIDTKIDTLKKKNIFLKKEINEIKNKKIIQEKEAKKIIGEIKKEFNLKENEIKQKDKIIKDIIKEKELVSFYDIERLEENGILEIKLKGNAIIYW